MNVLQVKDQTYSATVQKARRAAAEAVKAVIVLGFHDTMLGFHDWFCHRGRISLGTLIFEILVIHGFGHGPFTPSIGLHAQAVFGALPGAWGPLLCALQLVAASASAQFLGAGLPCLSLWPSGMAALWFPRGFICMHLWPLIHTIIVPYWFLMKLWMYFHMEPIHYLELRWISS